MLLKMLSRLVYIARPAYISKELGFLVINFYEDKDTKHIPLDDVGILLINNTRSAITIPAINSIIERKGIIVYCNAKYYPDSIVYPISSNYLSTKIIQAQASASKTLKKKLHRDIIKQKVLNQSLLLQKLGLPYKTLRNYIRKLKEPEILETNSARYYWQTLFRDKFPEFVRERNGPFPNSWLNFGYTLLRTAVARAIAISGLIPQLGIFHKRKNNPFVLADDLMEPFRSTIDYVVWQAINEFDTQGLNKDVIKFMLKVMFYPVYIEKMASPLISATVMTSTSLAKLLVGERKKLLLPKFFI